VDNGIRTHGL